MKVQMTEYLRLDLDAELWECRVCDHIIGTAHTGYKEGMLVYDRDPRDIHPPILAPEKYRYTFSPDPEWVRILEYYCPKCGTQVETEYVPPGHPPLHDMQPDLPALRTQWAGRTEVTEVAVGPAVTHSSDDHKH